VRKPSTRIKDSIHKTYGKRGEAVVQNNFAAVDHTLAHLHQVTMPAEAASNFDLRPAVPRDAPEFVQDVIAPMVSGKGDLLAVSAQPVDGTFPTATAKWEKRNCARDSGVGREDLHTMRQLGCPHGVILWSMDSSSRTTR
jgi:pyruvate-ferredoxin/flavodoxin oxidoreductase